MTRTHMRSRHGRTIARVLLCALVSASAVFAQAPVDSALATYIASIRAIDSHAHPMRPIRAGTAADTDFDALSLDGLAPFGFQHRLTLDDPIWRRAQNALYQTDAWPATTDSAYRAALAVTVARAVAERGDQFPAWALDQAGIDIMLANRVAMGPGLDAPRFRWVSFVDALMLPLDTRAEAAATPDTRALYPKEATLLKRYLLDLHLARLPSKLDAYVRAVVIPTLERHHTGGAVAVKFEAAYLRSLNFDNPEPAIARRVYARYVAAGVPSHADYKRLEDYLFRVIAREAGRLGMAVQIHTLESFGAFYSSAGAAPQLLESALNDTTLRGTKFVLVHGGWPRVNETQAMLAKPNVYTDISAMDLILSPTVLADVLRQWLTEFPDKVLFGTDAFETDAAQGWEQAAWVASMTARRALAIALTAMMRDGEIGRDRAQAVARMVLRENAIAAYGLKDR